MAEAKSYPAIRFVLRYRNALALLVGAAIMLFGLWCAFTGGGWMWGAIGVAAGLLAFLMLRAFAELVDVVADTLLPPE
jgi:hypothetical protein